MAGNEAKREDQIQFNDLVDENPFVGAEGNDDEDFDFDAEMAKLRQEQEEPADDPSPEADEDPSDDPADEPAAQLEDAEADSEESEPAPQDTPDAEEDPAEQPEGEDTLDAEADPAEPSDKDVPEEPAKAKRITIPKGRFDQEARRRRAAEQRVEELERQLRERGVGQQQPAAKEDADPVALPDVGEDATAMFTKLMKDGDVEQATSQFNNILSKVVTGALDQYGQRVEQQITTRVEQGVKSAQTRTTVDSVINNLKTTYEVFDETADSFDETLVRRTLSMQKALIDGEGYTPADALEEAAEQMLQLYHPELMKDDAEQAPPPPPPQRQADVQANRKKAQRQPAPPRSTPHKPAKTTKLDVMSMTDEEFEALTEEQLAELRGDFAE